MSYLARLKQLEDDKFSHNTLDIELPKPPKPPFDSFGSTDTGLYAKKISLNDDQQPDECKAGGSLKKLETLKDRQREASRQKAIAILNASPDIPRGIFVDDQIDPDNVVLFVAGREYQQTCELQIPRAKYNPLKLLALIERMESDHAE